MTLWLKFYHKNYFSEHYPVIYQTSISTYVFKKNKKKCENEKNLMLKINNRESNEMNPTGIEADKSHKTLSPTLPWSEQI